MSEFKLLEGGLQDLFLRSRKKIQIYGGGFGNGKTTASVMKALQIAKDYHGCNILMARATYPKLNDTLRKEFIKWCPKEWIASFPMSANATNANTCTLKNGSMINFRYIAQQGKSEESTTSNLLSATYDFALVDQMEDPEITYKDFLDILGRLRGQTVYRGEDETMPRTGPRWFGITLNPTRNWIYKKIVKPYHDYLATGKISDDLLCVRDPASNEPKLDMFGKPILLIDLVEGGTEANAHNLPEDFIESLGSIYTGQMKERFLQGGWAAYEGLIYPNFNQLVHMVDETRMMAYKEQLEKSNYKLRWVEGYDFGLAEPSCYLLGFIDPFGNIIVCDGYYRPEFDMLEQYTQISYLRHKWGADDSNIILADPDIFRRKGGKGERISDSFWVDGGLAVTAADNSIDAGIKKVASYLAPRLRWVNPFDGDEPAPSIYFSQALEFVADEMGSYFWAKDSTGNRVDTPAKSADHALDTIKYMLTNRPRASELRRVDPRRKPAWLSWHEQDAAEQERSRRHG